MSETDPRSELPGPATVDTPYVRFIILSGPRTGSNLLALSLNSHPEVTCFGEVFNDTLDFVMYNVDGYDNLSKADLALQRHEPLQFLQERIFSQHPAETRAVGFKYHYGQFWGYEGLLERLTGDRDLRVLHLQRRNLLRVLVSLKIAESTGVWMAPAGSGTTFSKARGAFRHPTRAVRKLSSLLKRTKAAGSVVPTRLSISPDELYAFIIRMEITRAKFDKMFGEHQKQTVLYEDLQRSREEVLNQAQTFLGVEPKSLAVTLRRQNPEPLRELLENYGELYEAFGDGDHGWMLEDG